MLKIYVIYKTIIVTIPINTLWALYQDSDNIHKKQCLRVKISVRSYHSRPQRQNSNPGPKFLLVLVYHAACNERLVRITATLQIW